MVENTDLNSPEGGFQSGHGHRHSDNPDDLHYNGYISDISRTMPAALNGDNQTNVCAGCGGGIVDRYYLYAADKQWHVTCLTCFDCKIPLDSELTCFCREGHIFCKEDYYRRFAIKRCSRCHLGISANELIMRAKDHVYHMSCFTCASCNKTLSPGDQFGMNENLIYCRTDYEFLFQCEIAQRLAVTPGGNNPFYNGITGTQKGRPRKRKHLMPEGEGCIQSLGLMAEGDIMSREGYGNGPPPRQKRVRTSFKHHQLRTMKSYFALNHNPDAKDLKQLSQKTGLSKRVLQVWFQNARAKYRRISLKSDSDKPDESGIKSTDDEKPVGDDSEQLVELNDSGSPAMSDISSSQSMSDVPDSAIEQEQSGDSLSELFTDSINSVH